MHNSIVSHFHGLFFARAKKQDKIVGYQTQLEPQRDEGSARLDSKLGHFNAHIFYV